MIAIPLFLCGCASFETKLAQPAVVHAMNWKQRSAALQQITTWHLDSSMSIQHDQKIDLASLIWDQQPHQYQFRLLGPLGFGKISITGSPSIVTLTQSGKLPISARTAETLMQNQLGWYVPISHLYDWARGLPAPNTTATMTTDANHRLIYLKQNGWEIHYLDYKSVGALDLPSKMTFTNSWVNIKWVVKNWAVTKQ